MVSIVKKIAFSAILVFLQSTALAQLECYSCRGVECAVLTDSTEVETCDPDSYQTTTASPDGTTDSDMNFDTDDVQVIEYPLLEKLENSLESVPDDSGLVIISSQLPGDTKYSSRKLKQMRDGEDMRCVYVTYNDPDSGDLSTVRGCASMQENNHATCLSQVPVNYVTCYVCDTDRCNAAVKLTGAIFALLLATLVAVRNVC